MTTLNVTEFDRLKTCHYQLNKYSVLTSDCDSEEIGSTQQAVNQFTGVKI